MKIFSGYAEALRIDDQINHLLEDHGITKENCSNWMNFARTIETSAILITEKAIKIKKGGMDQKEESKVLNIFWETFCHATERGEKTTPAEKAFSFLKALEDGGFNITPKGE